MLVKNLPFKKNTIKALLVGNDIKLKDVAKKAGVGIPMVSQVVNGHKSSLRVQKVISDMLNIPYEQLWGKSYKSKQSNKARRDSHGKSLAV